MLKRPRALVLQAREPLMLKRLENRLDMGSRQLEAGRHPLLVPPCRRHPDDRPAGLVGIGDGREGGQSECAWMRSVLGGQKTFEGVLIRLVAKLPLHQAHDGAQRDGGIELWYREDIARNGVRRAGRVRPARLRPPLAAAIQTFEDQAPGLVAPPGPLPLGLPPALCRRFGEEHNGPDDLVIVLAGIDTRPPEVVERFLR
jgi:hypothetical protein